MPENLQSTPHGDSPQPATGEFSDARVIWIMGLSGAGKTTLAQALQPRLGGQTRGRVVLVDGDCIRRVCGNDLGFTEADRVVQIGRMQRFAQLLVDQDVTVLVAALYANQELLEWNRRNLRGYFEIYIKASLPSLKDRDYKGVYQRPSQVVGMDIPWTEPCAPDVVIDGDHLQAVDTWVQTVLSALERKPGVASGEGRP